MAAARNLLQWHNDGFGGCFSADANPVQYPFNQEKASPVIVSSPMAEEEEEDVGCSTTSTTSKEEGDDNPYKGWLQLGIGGGQNYSSTEQTSSSSTNLQFQAEIPSPLTSTQPMITWGLRGQPPTTVTGYSFSQVLGCSGSSSFGPAAVGPGAEFGVVSLPPRSRSGVWFELRAAEIQGKQPFLPQIPKSYLRIKDGRVPVRLLMKYLANKLELDDESKVEISCRGQQLHPVLTLQHIRDNVWCTAPSTVTMMPIADHVMILHYGRRAL